MESKMQSNQIYRSVLKTAIQKALNKNLPQIMNDAVQYLEDHAIQVKQRKKRSKIKKLQNIDDLQKKTRGVSAQKIKTTAFFNLNTNRVVSTKVGKTHPLLKFGNIKQDNKTVWVCGTPNHLENTLITLQQNDEKEKPIFEPFSPMKTIVEEPAEDPVNEEPAENSINEEPAENSINEEPAEDPVNEEQVEDPVNEEQVEDPVNEEQVEDPVEEQVKDPVNEDLFNFNNDTTSNWDLFSENENISIFGNQESLFLEEPVEKPKKIKRRKKKPKKSSNMDIIPSNK